MNVLITGTAGFIGFHLANRLIGCHKKVTGIDSINDYYDPTLKLGRLEAAGIHEYPLYGKVIQSRSSELYQFIKLNLEDKASLEKLFEKEDFDIVIHLAAQAGVRYSIENPDAYINSNIVGFLNILECCRHYKIKHLVYASSSSVYGLNSNEVFSTEQSAVHPISLYAASKKSNELMAHTYSHLFHLPTTGLRFFTVYGPWGRPDMALFLFTKAISEGQPIKVFNNGEMYRDFTYVDDIVEGIIRIVSKIPMSQPDWNSLTMTANMSSAPYRIYNIGNSKPVKLFDFIEAIEKEMDKKANKVLLPLQPGDVTSTYADVSDLAREFGYQPSTSLEEGVKKFVKWYKKYYKVT